MGGSAVPAAVPGAMRRDAMETDEKGFVVKDRRVFDDRGDPREEETKETPDSNAEADAGKQDRSEEITSEKNQGEKSREEADQQWRSQPLPEVNFSTLIMSLSSSALLHMGEIPDPQTGRKTKDLSLAKHTIDTIGMLKDKTKGNLDDEEQRFLDTMLADLRWRFVKASG